MKVVWLLSDTLGTLRCKFTFVSHPSDDLNVSTSDIGTSVRIRFKLRIFEDKVFEKRQECKPRCHKHYKDWELRFWLSEVFLVIAGSQRVTDNCPQRAFLRNRTRGVALGEQPSCCFSDLFLYTSGDPSACLVGGKTYRLSS